MRARAQTFPTVLEWSYLSSHTADSQAEFFPPVSGREALLRDMYSSREIRRRCDGLPFVC